MTGPDGAVLWTYQKSHPVPGLEPYRPGTGVAPVVSTPYGRLSSVICYDAHFPSMMRADADIMLVPGGDWPQIGHVHSEMAGLRAIENGYSLVRQDYVSAGRWRSTAKAMRCPLRTPWSIRTSGWSTCRSTASPPPTA
ncbi:nitrilase-related carbon-nitrogen hydrolase [Lentzea xinjiangensis]|uniref:nitrilase-related carbon-nitrogen hydrolase n=1 Tax=Lentzea xinjiangensis TaxID=402600 RepID=UPI000AC8BDC1